MLDRFPSKHRGYTEYPILKMREKMKLPTFETFQKYWQIYEPETPMIDLSKAEYADAWQQKGNSRVIMIGMKDKENSNIK